MNSIEAKKAAILQVLSHFSSRPESALADLNYDYLFGSNQVSAEKLIKQKTTEFLKRINIYNEQELNLEWLIVVIFQTTNNKQQTTNNK